MHGGDPLEPAFPIPVRRTEVLGGIRITYSNVRQPVLAEASASWLVVPELPLNDHVGLPLLETVRENTP